MCCCDTNEYEYLQTLYEIKAVSFLVKLMFDNLPVNEKNEIKREISKSDFHNEIKTSMYYILEFGEP